MSSKDNVIIKSYVTADGSTVQVPIEKINNEALIYRCDGMRHLFQCIADMFISEDMLFNDDFIFIRDQVQACLTILEESYLQDFDNNYFAYCCRSDVPCPESD